MTQSTDTAHRNPAQRRGRNPGAVCVRGLIRAYQLVISPLFVPSCRYSPSCSRYALDAIGRFGVIRGGWLALLRLGSCHPWGGSGYDPVPRTPVGGDETAGR